MNVRQPKPASSFAARNRRSPSGPVRPKPEGGQSARRSYERYLVLARTAAQDGDVIGAENYYQHAEHFYRSIHPGDI